MMKIERLTSSALDPFNMLPDELLMHIFHFQLLDIEASSALRLTCKRFKAVVDHLIVGADDGMAACKTMGLWRALVTAPERPLSIGAHAPTLTARVAAIEAYERTRSKVLFFAHAKEVALAFPHLNEVAKQNKQDAELYRPENLNPAAKALGECLHTHRAVLAQKEDLVVSTHMLCYVPPEISYLCNLTSLNLSNAKPHQGKLQPGGLLSLPPEIGRLSHLDFLSLFNNRLDHLPEAFGELAHLQTLTLAQNWLSSLPATFAQLTNLKTLDLASNAFRTFPAEILQLTRLQELYLLDNQLSVVPQEIENLVCLRELSLEYNHITTFPPIAFPLLTFLHLTYNQLSTLPDTMGSCPQLRAINIAWNTMRSLPQTLLNLKDLNILDISHNVHILEDQATDALLLQLRLSDVRVVFCPSQATHPSRFRDG